MNNFNDAIFNDIRNESMNSDTREEALVMDSMSIFINYISLLEGAKTRIKNLHWAATGMTIHERLDELLGIVSDFQDTVAENSMGCIRQLQANEINAVPYVCYSGMEILQYLISRTEDFYEQIPQTVMFAGLKSETETFMHELHKYKYLFTLCKG